MRTDFSPEFIATDAGARANEILRSCVHCGFCNATCPTYQLTGDELDGPRGRIYLMREFLTDGSDPDRVIHHLDRCLTCRACETTCPSGVQYGELAEITRFEIGPTRPGWQGILRRFFAWAVPDPARFRWLANMARLVRVFMPKRIKNYLPATLGKGVLTGPADGNSEAQSEVLLLNGCLQQVTSASTNEHFVSLLEARGKRVVTLADEVCCGSLDLHAGDEPTAIKRIKASIDVLAPHLGHLDAIISTASGCGVTVKEYGRVMAHDPDYAERAERLSELCLDVSEYLHSLSEEHPFAAARPDATVAYHAPCTLQHGQKVTGFAEDTLVSAGYELTHVRDSHLCCGSAGSFSVLQPEMSGQLKSQKLAALQAENPDVLASSNFACQAHLAGDAEVEVVHWIELLN